MVVAVAKTVPDQVTEAGKSSRIWPILRCSSFAFRPSSQPVGSGPACRPLPIHLNHSILGQVLALGVPLLLFVWYCTGTKRTQNSAPRYCTSALYLGFISCFRTVYLTAVAPSFSACYLRLRAGFFANV